MWVVHEYMESECRHTSTMNSFAATKATPTHSLSLYGNPIALLIRASSSRSSDQSMSIATLAFYVEGLKNNIISLPST